MEAVRRGEYAALRGSWREQEAYFLGTVYRSALLEGADAEAVELGAASSRVFG